MNMPTNKEVEVLHKKYAPTPEVLELVYTHCNIVNDIAQQLIAANNLKVDAELVKVGCLFFAFSLSKVYCLS